MSDWAAMSMTRPLGAAPAAAPGRVRTAAQGFGRSQGMTFGGKPWPKSSRGSSSGAGSGAQSRANRYLGVIGGLSNTLSGIGGQLMGDYNRHFRPLMPQLVSSATTSPNDIAAEAGVDANLQFAKSRDIMRRDLARMGINPNSGKFAGLEQQWARSRAAAMAGAMTRAGRQSRLDNFSRMSQLMGLSPLGSATRAYGDAASYANTAQRGYDDLAEEQGLQQGYARGRGSFQSDIDALLAGG